jgi:uncharacterized membrane protein
MRVWTSVAIAACCALGIALSAPAYAQPAPPPPKAPGGGGPGGGGGGPGGPGAPGGPGGGGSPKFIVSVCNKSGIKNVWIAFASLKDPSTWHVHGWYKVPDTGCGNVGEFYKDTAYYLAVDGTLQFSWTGEDTEQCVNPAKQFDHAGGQAYQCTADDVIVGFTKIQTTKAKFEITLLGSQ